jgi:hypothetical protein
MSDFDLGEQDDASAFFFGSCNRSKGRPRRQTIPTATFAMGNRFTTYGNGAKATRSPANTIRD